MGLSTMIKRAIEIGERQGFITFDQIDELVPSSAHRLEPEVIETLFEALSDHGIDVREA
ncbi:RNA polymerase sigma factor region1.1 domain-containing protein [Bradyrhizobium jicamae]|uniref:RNA polymerase sigma factor region1.1 domain-containing protein n=1 Tax=Bradyrhizobium jicamae TaxID=280332 RepID=UPI0009F8DDB3|nr:RNA polymerase sigma factor region1.1 domain-containing protein [Bradyrhizobium jicamae]